MDIDEELLNLYDGIDVAESSSSKPKKSKGDKKRKRDLVDESGSDMEMSNNESDGEIPAQASTSTSRKTARTAASSDEEDEDEDDDAVGEDEDDEAETFTYEKLYKSREDKDELEELPELQREAELARRQDVLDKRRLRQQLRTMTRPTKQSTRVKKTTGVTKEKESALSKYKATRASRSDRKLAAAKRGMGQADDDEEDDDGEAARAERLARRRSASGGTESDVDSDEDGEARAKEDPEDKLPVKFEDLVKLQLPRWRFAQQLFKPHFEEYVKGCFVRLFIGDPSDRSKTKYRIYQIDRVEDGDREYKLEEFKTKKRIGLKLAAQDFVMPMDRVSGEPITEQEFESWKSFMVVGRVKLPTKGFVKKKTREMTKLKSLGTTEEELNDKLKSKNASLKTRNPALYRATVVDKLDVARRDDKAEDIEALETELKMIDERLAGREQAADPMAAINERNRLKNREEVRRAEAAAAEARRKQAEQLARNLTTGTPAKIDASARVKTNVRRLHHVNGSAPSSQPASQPGMPAAQASTPAAPHKSPETMRVDERIAQSVTISADDLF